MAEQMQRNMGDTRDRGKGCRFNIGCALLLLLLQVPRGSKVLLPHLSLLEIAGEPLLFMINGMAVQRAVARSSQLVM